MDNECNVNYYNQLISGIKDINLNSFFQRDNIFKNKYMISKMESGLKNFNKLQN